MSIEFQRAKQRYATNRETAYRYAATTMSALRLFKNRDQYARLRVRVMES